MQFYIFPTKFIIVAFLQKATVEYLSKSVCVCVCVCVHAQGCARVCVCVCFLSKINHSRNMKIKCIVNSIKRRLRRQKNHADPISGPKNYTDP